MTASDESRATAAPAPGWYPDPGGAPGTLRYWSGQSWTADRAQLQAAPEPGPGYARLSAATVGLLALSGLVSVAGLAEKVWAYRQVGEWQADPGLFTTAAAEHFDSLELAFALAETALVLVTGIFVLVWQAKTYVSAAVDRGELRRGRALSLWSWVIPFVGAWWPLQNLRDLWWSARPVATRTKVRHHRPIPLVMFVWWFSWLLSLVLARTQGVITAADNSLKALKDSVAVGLGSELTTVIAAATCAWIVASITARVRAGGYRAR